MLYLQDIFFEPSYFNSKSSHFLPLIAPEVFLREHILERYVRFSTPCGPVSGDLSLSAQMYRSKLRLMDLVLVWVSLQPA